MHGVTTPETMPPAAPDISIVIPHYNDLANLAVCIACLRGQRGEVGAVEIVVADNNSACSPAELAAACGPGVRVVPAPIQGAAAARNAGIAAARASRLAFIDSDCRPAPDWLAQGRAALDRHDLVGGRMIVSVADRRAPSAAEALELVFAFNNERYIREERFSVTANMFAARAVFDRVGGFRGHVSEDREWGQRAAAMGYRWHYAPEARVEHPARRTWSDLHRKWRRIMAESFALFRSRQGRPVLWLARNWLALLSVPLTLPKIAASRDVTALRDRLKLFAMLVRLRAWRVAEAHRLARRVADRPR